MREEHDRPDDLGISGNSPRPDPPADQPPEASKRQEEEDKIAARGVEIDKGDGANGVEAEDKDSSPEAVPAKRRLRRWAIRLSIVAAVLAVVGYLLFQPWVGSVSTTDKFVLDAGYGKSMYLLGTSGLDEKIARRQGCEILEQKTISSNISPLTVLFELKKGYLVFEMERVSKLRVPMLTGDVIMILNQKVKGTKEGLQIDVTLAEPVPLFVERDLLVYTMRNQVGTLKDYQYHIKIIRDETNQTKAEISSIIDLDINKWGQAANMFTKGGLAKTLRDEEERFLQITKEEMQAVVKAELKWPMSTILGN